MKVIFLDHDGVVCTSLQWGTRLTKQRNWAKKHSSTLDEAKKLPINRMDNFDKKAVKILNEILDETGAEIVVSSDWKLHCSLEEMQELYTIYGVNKVPIGMTKDLASFDPYTADLFIWKRWLERARMVEIRKYLEEHPEIEQWVSIDDLEMFELVNFVHTPRSSEGIKQTGIKKLIIEKLNEEL